MTSDAEPIRIVRGPGGEVEVLGGFDAFAGEILRRADFLFEPSLSGWWVRLPFGTGRRCENERASWAAEMLTAARYPVQLDPTLRAELTEQSAPAGPARPPTMTAQGPPPGRRPHR